MDLNNSSQLKNDNNNQLHQQELLTKVDHLMETESSKTTLLASPQLQKQSMDSTPDLMKSAAATTSNNIKKKVINVSTNGQNSRGKRSPIGGPDQIDIRNVAQLNEPRMDLARTPTPIRRYKEQMRAERLPSIHSSSIMSSEYLREWESPEQRDKVMDRFRAFDMHSGLDVYDMIMATQQQAIEQQVEAVRAAEEIKQKARAQQLKMQKMKRQLNQMPKLPTNLATYNISKAKSPKLLANESNLLSESKQQAAQDGENVDEQNSKMVFGAEHFIQGETRDFVGANIRNARKKAIKPFQKRKQSEAIHSTSQRLGANPSSNFLPLKQQLSQNSLRVSGQNSDEKTSGGDPKLKTNLQSFTIASPQMHDMMLSSNNSVVSPKLLNNEDQTDSNEIQKNKHTAQGQSQKQYATQAERYIRLAAENLQSAKDLKSFNCFDIKNYQEQNRKFGVALPGEKRDNYYRMTTPEREKIDDRDFKRYLKQNVDKTNQQIEQIIRNSYYKQEERTKRMQEKKQKFMKQPTLIQEQIRSTIVNEALERAGPTSSKNLPTPILDLSLNSTLKANDFGKTKHAKSIVKPNQTARDILQKARSEVDQLDQIKQFANKMHLPRKQSINSNSKRGAGGLYKIKFGGLESVQQMEVINEVGTAGHMRSIQQMHKTFENTSSNFAKNDGQMQEIGEQIEQSYLPPALKNVLETNIGQKSRFHARSRSVQPLGRANIQQAPKLPKTDRKLKEQSLVHRKVQHFALYDQALKLVKNTRNLQHTSDNKSLRGFSDELAKNLLHKNSVTPFLNNDKGVLSNFNNFKVNDRLFGFKVEDFYFLKKGLQSLPDKDASQSSEYVDEKMQTQSSINQFRENQKKEMQKFTENNDVIHVTIDRDSLVSLIMLSDKEIKDEIKDGGIDQQQFENEQNQPSSMVTSASQVVVDPYGKKKKGQRVESYLAHLNIPFQPPNKEMDPQNMTLEHNTDLVHDNMLFEGTMSQMKDSQGNSPEQASNNSPTVVRSMFGQHVADQQQKFAQNSTGYNNATLPLRDRGLAHQQSTGSNFDNFASTIGYDHTNTMQLRQKMNTGVSESFNLSPIAQKDNQHSKFAKQPQPQSSADLNLLQQDTAVLQEGSHNNRNQRQHNDALMNQVHPPPPLPLTLTSGQDQEKTAKRTTTLRDREGRIVENSTTSRPTGQTAEQDYKNATGKSFGQKQHSQIAGLTQNSKKSKVMLVQQQTKGVSPNQKKGQQIGNQQNSSKSPSKSQLTKNILFSSTTLKQEEVQIEENANQQQNQDQSSSNRASKSAIAKQPIFSKFDQSSHLLKSSVSKNAPTNQKTSNSKQLGGGQGVGVSSTTVVAAMEQDQSAIEQILVSTQERDNTPIQTSTNKDMQQMGVDQTNDQEDFLLSRTLQNTKQEEKDSDKREDGEDDEDEIEDLQEEKTPKSQKLLNQQDSNLTKIKQEDAAGKESEPQLGTTTMNGQKEGLITRQIETTNQESKPTHVNINNNSNTNEVVTVNGNQILEEFQNSRGQLLLHENDSLKQISLMGDYTPKHNHLNNDDGMGGDLLVANVVPFDRTSQREEKVSPLFNTAVKQTMQTADFGEFSKDNQPDTQKSVAYLMSQGSGQSVHNGGEPKNSSDDPERNEFKHQQRQVELANQMGEKSAEMGLGDTHMSLLKGHSDILQQDFNFKVNGINTPLALAAMQARESENMTPGQEMDMKLFEEIRKLDADFRHVNFGIPITLSTFEKFKPKRIDKEKDVHKYRNWLHIQVIMMRQRLQQRIESFSQNIRQFKVKEQRRNEFRQEAINGPDLIRKKALLQEQREQAQLAQQASTLLLLDGTGRLSSPARQQLQMILGPKSSRQALGPKLGQDVERKVRKLLSGTKLSNMAHSGKVLLEISNNSNVQGSANGLSGNNQAGQNNQNQARVSAQGESLDQKQGGGNNFAKTAQSTHQVGSSGLQTSKICLSPREFPEPKQELMMRIHDNKRAIDREIYRRRQEVRSRSPSKNHSPSPSALSLA